MSRIPEDVRMTLADSENVDASSEHYDKQMLTIIFLFAVLGFIYYTLTVW